MLQYLFDVYVMYTYICLFVFLLVCPFVFNKVGPTFCVGPHMAQGRFMDAQNYKNLCPNSFRFLLNFEKKREEATATDRDTFKSLNRNGHKRLKNLVFVYF